MEEGAEKKPQDVFCSGNTTESKTEDGDVPSTPGVSVVATGDGGGSGDGDDDDQDGKSESSTRTASSDVSSETGSGASGGDVRSSISFTLMAAGSIMFFCFAIGAL